MVRLQLNDAQWTKIAAHLKAERGVGRPPKDDRMFVEAVLWWRRTGAPWRDLPSEFGPWTTVFNRFDRWSKTGKWTRLLHALRGDVDAEWHAKGTLPAEKGGLVAGDRSFARRRRQRST